MVLLKVSRRRERCRRTPVFKSVYIIIRNSKIQNLSVQPIHFFLYLLLTGCDWWGFWRRVVIFNGPVYSSSFYDLNFTTRDRFEHVSSCVTAILDSAVLAFTYDRWYSRFGMLILIVIHILIMDIRSFVFWPAVVLLIDIVVMTMTTRELLNWIF